MTSSPLALEVKSLRVRRPDFELRADFSVEAGCRLVLKGKSGSGKTTLLRVIAGFEPWESRSGAILLRGKIIHQLPPEHRCIGFVFQDQALFTSMSVLDNAVFGLRMRGIKKRDRETQGIEWLRRVGLESVLPTPVGRLSGGERQRLALVRAMIWKPSLLLLDEPFSALDPATRQELRNLVLELQSDLKVPMIFVTHDEDDAEALATDRIEVRRIGQLRIIGNLNGSSGD